MSALRYRLMYQLPDGTAESCLTSDTDGYTWDELVETLRQLGETARMYTVVPADDRWRVYFVSVCLGAAEVESAATRDFNALGFCGPAPIADLKRALDARSHGMGDDLHYIFRYAGS